LFFFKKNCDKRKERHLRAEKGLIRPPNESDKNALKACYINCIEVANNEKFESIAFPGISTGLYGYPKEDAADLVVKSCLEWLENNPETSLKRILFCCFEKDDVDIYNKFILKAKETTARNRSENLKQGKLGKSGAVELIDFKIDEKLPSGSELAVVGIFFPPHISFVKLSSLPSSK